MLPQARPARTSPLHEDGSAVPSAFSMCAPGTGLSLTVSRSRPADEHVALQRRLALAL